MNYLAKVIGQTNFSFINDREIGSPIYVHIYEDGKVLLYAPYDRAKKLPTFDYMCDSIEEAKKYATCIRKTQFDVEKSFSKMMSDRYW